VGEQRGPDALRVALIDPHVLLSHTLADVLTTSGVIAEPVWADTSREITAEIEEFRPDIALVECDVPSPLGPADALVQAVTRLGVVAVVLTASTDHRTLGACLEAGAVGIVDKKQASFADLIAAIHAATRRDGVLSMEAQNVLSQLRRTRSDERWDRVSFELLTPRETDVLAFLCQGWSAAEIADHTYVSLATVRSHIRSILLKLGVRSQLAAAAKAYSTGWYEAEISIHQS
jgi:DNA-binding NarL/FixJ family response regulator